MNTRTRFVLVFVAVAAGGAVNALLSNAAERTVKLTVYDSVVKPGERAMLAAKLEQQGIAGINPDLKGYPLKFSGEPAWSADAKTGKDGRAETTIGLPEKAKTPLPFTVKFPGSDNHESAERGGTIFIWPEDSRILVTDIDHTISDFSQLKLGTADIKNIPPLKGAPEALTELAKTYRIVYLTAREDALLNKTKDWLRLKGFPDGPVFTRDNLVTTTQEGFKTDFLKEFSKRYAKLEIGVAERPADARAYLENGLKPYMIDPEGKHEYPKRSMVVKSWDELREQLTKKTPNR